VAVISVFKVLIEMFQNVQDVAIVGLSDTFKARISGKPLKFSCTLVFSY
jgi:hypothetical protein